MQKRRLAILLSLLLAPALTRAHTPDEEADAIRRAREAEIEYRQAHEGKWDSEAAQCKYVSEISTPPPLMRVALTFDDGPDPTGTPYVLGVLAKYRATGAFFLKGDAATQYPELVRRIKAEGHLIIGNHSWNHPDFHKLTEAEQSAQIKKTAALLRQYQAQKFFRYPYGNSTCYGNDLAHSLGYKIVGWHVDSCDWAFNKTGKVDFKTAGICGVKPENVARFQEHVVDSLKRRGGGILLMHDIQPNTIRQLDALLEKLVHGGFTFGKLSEKGFAPSLR